MIGNGLQIVFFNHFKGSYSKEIVFRGLIVKGFYKIKNQYLIIVTNY